MTPKLSLASPGSVAPLQNLRDCRLVLARSDSLEEFRSPLLVKPVDRGTVREIMTSLASSAVSLVLDVVWQSLCDDKFMREKYDDCLFQVSYNSYMEQHSSFPIHFSEPSFSAGRYV